MELPLAVFLALATGVEALWDANQVNETTCSWPGLRATVLKDTLFLDGGKFMTVPGYADGSTKGVQFPASQDFFYTFNFSTSVSVTQNVSAIFKQIPKLGNSVLPIVSSGALLSNDYGFFMYGGLLTKSDSYSPPPESEIYRYEAEAYGIQKPAFKPGMIRTRITDGVPSYLAFGGVANAPSENKAFYFGGMRSPTNDVLFDYSTAYPNQTAATISNKLITVDLSDQYGVKWNNKTLPTNILSRADPSMVWVPVGSQGILVVLGGVTSPGWNTLSQTSKNNAAKEADKVFISTIDVYDIAGDKWYQQNSSAGGPTGPLARGCAVLAYPDDGSSFNIYYYGGYDGYDAYSVHSDDVWVLSLPSFTWTKLSTGTAVHARAGHACVQPDPATMMIVGGLGQLPSRGFRCLDEFVTFYNLTSGKWLNSYDPSKYAKYGINELITAKIGGNALGGATKLSPEPAWADPSLGSVFTTPYAISKIKAYYPYSPAAVVNNTNPTVDSPGGGGGGNNLPSFLAPLLGTVLGVMLITAIGVAVLVFKRRKLLGAKDGSMAGTEDNGHRILSWMRGQPSEKAPPTVTTTALDDERRIISPEPPTIVSTPSPEPPPMVHHEIEDTQIAELLGDTYPRYVELQDTGLSPVDIINHYTHLGQGGGSVQNSSLHTAAVHGDHASAISRATDPAAPAAHSDLRADSPPLGIHAHHFYQPILASEQAQFAVTEHHPPADHTVPAATTAAADESAADNGARILSGVSGLSERDRAHLRQTSDTSAVTVSTMNTRVPEPLGPAIAAAAANPVISERPEAHRTTSGNGVGAVSPPTPGQLGEGDDYITPHRGAPPMSPSAVSCISPRRRSMFHENEDDMDDQQRRF